MPLKDYYKTLGVPANSTLQDIKAAYRKLAFQYHPDKNPENTYAAALFQELHEAYQTLSNTNRRKIYDEDLWLSGMGMRMHDHAITPQWLLLECKRLYEHMRKIDTYRMSHNALSEYIMMLLSDAHMAVLLQQRDDEINTQIIEYIITVTQKLQAEHIPAIAQRLAQLAGNNEELLHKIQDYVLQRKKQAGRDKLFPVLIILLTLLLAIFMYLYGKRQ
jgi:hypothetical protein